MGIRINQTDVTGRVTVDGWTEVLRRRENKGEEGGTWATIPRSDVLTRPTGANC